jgi:hypothetical protein
MPSGAFIFFPYVTKRVPSALVSMMAGYHGSITLAYAHRLSLKVKSAPQIMASRNSGVTRESFLNLAGKRKRHVPLESNGNCHEGPVLARTGHSPKCFFARGDLVGAFNDHQAYNICSHASQYRGRIEIL